MAIAKNEEEFQEIQSEDTIKKTKLEIPFRKDVSRFLRKVNKEFEEEYIATGDVINAEEFKEELVALLLLNYNRVGKEFKFNVRESFKEQVSPEINSLINRKVSNNFKELSLLRSGLILDNTNKKISNELSSTISDFIEEHRDINNIDIAKETKKKLNAQVVGRSGTIATTEIQTSAESTKDIERETLKENNIVLDGVILATALKAVWIARFINTRPWHEAAHGQFKGQMASGGYIVDGQFLRYPGDPNGSPRNIINCYCSEVTTIV